MDEQIAIPGSEDEAGAELEGIFSETVLAVTGGLGACACLGVLWTEQVQQVSRFQSRGLVGFALGIDQQRKRDAGFFAKQAGIVHVAQSDRHQLGSGLLELLLVLAQLRDMLAAEDSTVVPQEDNYGRIVLPQRAEPDITAGSVGQHNIRELRTERFRHAPIVSDHGG